MNLPAKAPIDAEFEVVKEGRRPSVINWPKAAFTGAWLMLMLATPFYFGYVERDGGMVVLSVLAIVVTAVGIVCASLNERRL